LEIALAAARAGAQILRQAGLKPRIGRTKSGPGDYVTEIDEASEAAVIEILERETPEIPILAEERGGVESTTMWVVDPLDGTANFIRGLPIFATSVALISNGIPEVGVTIAPWLNLEFAAQRGYGATRNGNLLPRLGQTDPAQALVVVDPPFRKKEELRPSYLKLLEASLSHFEDLRYTGSATLNLAWVAAGNLHGYAVRTLSGPWDSAAGAVMLAEVGGVITDWSGGASWLSSGEVLAGSPAVHALLLEFATFQR
ncbi:MAG: inositol monophosphatase family protein, partial [Candidatus Dormibacteraceae bacterium]